MFPNPQDALPLPPKPSIERYRKLAKHLVKAFKSGDPEAVRGWAERWIDGLIKLSGLAITPELSVRTQRWIDEVEEFARRRMMASRSAGGERALAGAQFVIARSHGFQRWAAFAEHVETLSRSGSPVSKFEAAAEAIVSGDLETLRRFLRERPDLIRVRSTREHGATLLHYVAANGVEAYRQRTPKNVVQIAETLLEAGAEIDATADVYGGGCTTLGLAATSVHPERAGVQEALLQTLLDHGANVNRPSGAGNGQSMVTACVANGRLKAAEFLASRGAQLDLVGAAALGRLDLVKTYFKEDGILSPSATREQLKQGFLYACGYSHNDVIEFLLQKGADVAAKDGNGQTGLHWAVIGGHLDTVKFLLSYKAPLEMKNIYGGTVLGQALWSAGHGGDPEVYVAILETLIEAGAQLPGRHVPVNKRVDEWLERHGSHAERDWYWYGEKPRAEERAG